MAENRLTIYTDGACRDNPGPGGWGVLMVDGDVIEELGGAELHTTNNRMELRAAIEALRHVRQARPILVVSDSLYLKNGITEWLPRWKRRGWKTVGRKPVKNKDLWLMLDELATQYEIEWRWVRGHSGHPENEHVDAVANDHIDRLLAYRRSVEEKS